MKGRRCRGVSQFVSYGTRYTLRCILPEGHRDEDCITDEIEEASCDGD